MAVWFGLERLAYNHTKGEHWFLQVFPDFIHGLRWPNKKVLPRDEELGGEDEVNPERSSTVSVCPPKRNLSTNHMYPG